MWCTTCPRTMMFVLPLYKWNWQWRKLCNRFLSSHSIDYNMNLFYRLTYRAIQITEKKKYGCSIKFSQVDLLQRWRSGRSFSWSWRRGLILGGYMTQSVLEHMISCLAFCIGGISRWIQKKWKYWNLHFRGSTHSLPGGEVPFSSGPGTCLGDWVSQIPGGNLGSDLQGIFKICVAAPGWNGTGSLICRWLA